VLALKKLGSDEQVLLGPVELTDVIRNGDFESKTPVPLAHPLFYTTTLTAPQKRRPQAVLPSPTAPPLLSLPSMTPPQVPQGLFKTWPICCEGGVGLHFSYDNGSTGRLSATVQLHVERPTVSFHIRIGVGKLIDAHFQLHGAGGLRYDLHGATTNVSGNVRSGPIWVPGSVTIPLAGPLAITLTQAFDVSMQLSGAADFRASGDYSISGDLGFGFRDGRAVADAVAMSSHRPLVEDTHSDSLGVNAISVGWSVRADVGIGLGGFSAGAWFAMTPGLSLAFDGSPMSLRQGCATSSLVVTDKYGFGYTIPNYALSVINTILGLARVKPIPARGGPSWGPFTVWKPPQDQYCIPHALQTGSG
jgi:hypothetical protein